MADLRSRITLDGVEDIVRNFRRVGAEGERAFGQAAAGADKTSRVFNELARSSNVLVNSFIKLRAGLNGISAGFTTAINGLGGIKTAIAGLAAAEGVRKVGETISQVTENLNQLRNVSAGTGAPVDAIVGFQDALADAGAAGKKVGPMFIQFAGALADAQKNAVNLNSTLNPTINVLKGAEGSVNLATRGVVTMRGALSDAATAGQQMAQVFDGSVQRQIGDVSNAFGMLGLNANAFRGPGGIVAAIDAFAKAYVRMKAINPQRAARAGALAFGEDDITEMGKALEKIATFGFPKYIAAAKQAGRVPTTDDFARLDQYNLAVANLNRTFSQFEVTAVIAAYPALTTVITAATSAFSAAVPIVNAVATAIKDYGVQIQTTFSQGGLAALHKQQLAEIQVAWTALTTFLSSTVWPLIQTGWQGALDLMGAAFTAWATGATQTMTGFTDWLTGQFTQIGNAASSVFSWLAGQISKISAALGSLSSNAIIAGGAMPFASGGQVPGSGTGDTVPAWLTPGEFVMRRSVVNALGAPFFAMLNAGMGSHLPRTRFATGGIVAGAAAGGTPVHLHLGGHSFALTGGADVVQSLAHEARRYQLRSAGTKPSWYGGTPGGR